MKKILLNSVLILTSVALFTACNNKSAENADGTATDSTALEATYPINPELSTVKWKGEMLNMYSHEGTVALQEGVLTTEGGKVKSGSFTVELSKIVPTDSNYDNKDRKKENLVGHLSSPDFFDVANYPTATFVIGTVNGNEATGTLTIKGKSNEETIKNIVLTEEGDVVKATGTLTFDRKKYDVMFDMTMKDMVLSNDIVLTIELTGNKQK